MINRNDVSESLAVLVAFDPRDASRDELGAMMQHSNRLRGWLDANDVRFSRRFAELADNGHSESASTALTDTGRRSGKEAKATVERDQVCTAMPSFESALADGEVSSEHIDVLARITKNLSDDERSDFEQRERDLVDMAKTEYVSNYDRRCRSIVDEIKQRHAPADDAAELDRQRAASKVSQWVDRASGMHKNLIELDPIRQAAFDGALQAQLAALKQEPGNARLPFQQLQVDALIGAMSAGEPAARIPEAIVLIDHESLTNGPHERTVCETENGVPLPVSTIRRLCCEAVVIPVVLGGEGEALDVGRERRTASRAQRRALRAMYRSCAHPHCTVGFARCRIHHVRWWWEHRGPTDLANLIPLCEEHHHLVHEGRWTLTMSPDRSCRWLRPDGSVWHEGPSINRSQLARLPERMAPESALDNEIQRSESWQQPSLL